MTMPLVLAGQHSRGFLPHLLGCRHGATTIMVAISAAALALAGLLAVDIARLHLVHTRLQYATDASTLAAARDAASPTLAQDMRQVFDANLPPGYLGSSTRRFEARTVTGEGGVLTLSLDVELTLPSLVAEYSRTFGIDAFSLEVAAAAERRTRGTELAMVLDNTGSMNGQPIQDLRAAAQALADTIFNGHESVPNLYVAIVPYTATVNIGTRHAAWLSSALRSYAPTSWKGCVMARSAPHDQNDDPPTLDGFSPFFWSSSVVGGEVNIKNKSKWDAYHALSPNVWPNNSGGVDERQSAANNGYGPNLGCGPPITPLTASYTTIKAAIAKLDAWHRGGTMANIGLVWGWRTLSPRWRNLWISQSGTTISTRPLDYDHPFNSKVVVLMTDGVNQWYQSDLTAYGRPDANSLGGQSIDSRMLAACTALKAQGVVVFTITFGSGVNATTRALFQNCASKENQNPNFPGPKYFYAPSGTQLKSAFSDIAGQLTELRLVR